MDGEMNSYSPRPQVLINASRSMYVLKLHKIVTWGTSDLGFSCVCYSMGCWLCRILCKQCISTQATCVKHHVSQQRFRDPFIILNALRPFTEKSFKLVFNPVFITYSPSAWPLLKKHVNVS